MGASGCRNDAVAWVAGKGRRQPRGQDRDLGCDVEKDQARRLHVVTEGPLEILVSSYS